MIDIKELLAKIMRNTPEIRYGALSAGSVPANSYVDVPVTFSSPMKGTPTVFAALSSTSTASTLGSFLASANDPTKNGCTIRVFNNTSSARTPALRYIAFYGGGFKITRLLSTVAHRVERRWAYVRQQAAAGVPDESDQTRGGRTQRIIYTGEGIAEHDNSDRYKNRILARRHHRMAPGRHRRRTDRTVFVLHISEIAGLGDCDFRNEEQQHDDRRERNVQLFDTLAETLIPGRGCVTC